MTPATAHPARRGDCLLPLPQGCEARCPACAHRRWSSAQSHAQKAAWLRQRLSPWAETLAPLRAAGPRWGYRDKVCLATRWDRAWRHGLVFRQELVPIPACPVHTSRVRRVVGLLGRALPPVEAFPMVYHVQAGAQMVLVLKTATLPALNWLDDGVTSELARLGIEGLWLHLHPAAGRRVLGKPGWHLIWGQARSTDARGLAYGPTSFQQLLPELHDDALAAAEAHLQPTSDSLVVDLCCGVGASLRRWLAAGAQAVGVELGAEALACAAVNAPQAALLRGRCAQRLPQLAALLRRTSGERLLYANPPRTGLEPEVVAWVRQLRPARVAYLSCSAGTLARDLAGFERAGLCVMRLIPYDFFPQTRHVEVLALLGRAGSPNERR